MSLAVPLDSPLYFATQGGGLAGVPHKFDVAIAGRGYMLDTTSTQFSTSIPNWNTKTVPLIRTQADTGKRTGEQSLNPEDLWRRSAETWTGGAGQSWYDRSFSDDGRFRSSRGIDCWTRGELSLLPIAEQSLSSAASVALLAVAGAYLYCVNANALQYTTDLGSWTDVTPGSLLFDNPTAIASDGHHVWVCDANDLYYTTRGGSTYDPWHGASFGCDLVRYAKGRIITAVGQAVYNNSAVQGDPVPTPFYTNPNSDWSWVDITEGPSAIYLAGFSGDKSLIYRTAVRSDGVQLDIPIVAGELPDGELVRSIQGYLGFLLIGSNLGVRFATLDAQGNISALGDLIEINGGVTCFEPQDRFVWFGWTNYDSAGTGLGRIDLRTFNGTSPAYASDLMAELVQGAVNSVVSFGGLRVFSVAGSGVWAESATDLVPVGTIDSGYIGYDLPDPKTAVNLVTRHAKGAGVYTASLSVDLRSFALLGSPVAPAATSGGGDQLSCPSSARGELFEVRLNLYRLLTDATSGPTFTRWTLRADAGATRRLVITLPLNLKREVLCRNNATEVYDVIYERERLEALILSRQIIAFQEGTIVRSVILEDFEWQPLQPGPKDHPDPQGTLVVSMKTL